MEVFTKTHLKTRAINNIYKFYHDSSIVLDNLIKFQLDSQIQYAFNTGVSFFVCGKELDGLYRIYLLSVNPRQKPQATGEGYAAIGSGKILPSIP